MPSISEILKEVRSRLDVSQEGMARDMDVSYKTVARYEGHMPPSGEALLKLIRWVESKNLRLQAAQLRAHYIRDMGEEIYRSLVGAYLQQGEIMRYCATIDAYCKEEQVEFAVDKIREATELIKSVLDRVLALEHREDGATVIPIRKKKE